MVIKKVIGELFIKDMSLRLQYSYHKILIDERIIVYLNSPEETWVLLRVNFDIFGRVSVFTTFIIH